MQTQLLKFSVFLFLVTLVYTNDCSAQFYNKEIVAKIKVEDKSEFIEFSAIAENISPTDRSLRYEFALFKKDASGNTGKSSQGNRFFLGASQKEILATTQVNRSEDGIITVLLIIYDLDDKPLGKDRLEFKISEKAIQEITEKQKQVIRLSQDEAKPQDGVVFNGFVIQNTITKAGRDFYRYFYSEYYNRQVVSPQNIEILEVPGRGRMTRISVKVGDQLVMQFFAQPKKEFLKQMAGVSLVRVLAQIQRIEQQENYFKHY